MSGNLSGHAGLDHDKAGHELEPSAGSDVIRQAAKARFDKLAATWKQETRFISNVTTKAMHPAYQKIIGMGDAAVSLILHDLVDHGPNDWFWALHVITDANPITADVAGNMRAMTEAWIQWGRDEGYLIADLPKKTKRASPPAIRVSTGGDAGPYVMLPLSRLDEIQAVLDANKIKYWVDDEVISLDGEPEEAIINFSRYADPAVIQRLLDGLS